MHTKVLLSKTDIYRKHQRDVKAYIHLVRMHLDTFRGHGAFERSRQCTNLSQLKYLKM